MYAAAPYDLTLASTKMCRQVLLSTLVEGRNRETVSET